MKVAVLMGSPRDGDKMAPAAETLEKFGGPAKFAKAVDDVLTRLGSYVGDAAKLRALLFGGA